MLQAKGNYRWNFLMDLCIKFTYNFHLFEILVNQNQQYMIRTVHQDQERFILGTQGWFNI